MNALPLEYKKQLHPSQIYRYKNQFEVKEYFGNELTNISNDVIDTIKKINEHKIERKIIYGFLRITSVVRNIFGKTKHFHKTLFENKDQIVDIVQRVQESISVKKCAKIIGVCKPTLENWIKSVRVRCSGSLINLCRKVHPHQLLPIETDAMRKLLMSEQMKFWPLVSVYYHSLHNNIINMSLSTWYKYASLLNIKRPKPKSVKQYGESIRALFPNQYWHADVMQFRTKDGTMNYIYLVVDNFSKMILSWKVNTKLSGLLRAETFREAIKTAIKYHHSIESVNLIVDGGSENNNITVDAFIQSLAHIELRKIRALKDVCFSNSMAEAVNRIIKTAYLNQRDILNTENLLKMLSEAVYDYAFLRPHGSINGLIPIESYTRKTINFIKLQMQMQKTREERISKNKFQSCLKCLY